MEITQESLSAYFDENPELRKQLEAEGKWPFETEGLSSSG